MGNPGLPALTPGAHGLNLLPLFSGERSPGWAADATAVISGLRMSTKPIHFLQAALEAVAYRFDLVWRMLLPYVSYDCRIVAGGGALTGSPYRLQVMADVLSRTVSVCVEYEATSRGDCGPGFPGNLVEARRCARRVGRYIRTESTSN